MIDAIVAFCTTNSQDEAKRIATALVNENLAACVNIISNMTSIYRWENELCTDFELILIIKSVREKLPVLIDRIKELHSYDIPEIIAVPVLGGSEAYLNWLASETRR